MTTKEIWKPIPNYENLYEVSNLGRVRSLPKSNRAFTMVKACGVMKSTGYPFTTLYMEGKARGFHIHTLVLSAFVGPCPEGMECCHRNGDRANSKLSNLRYGTRKSNHADKISHGTWQGGENNAASKLTWADIPVIRRRALRGHSYRNIALDYGVTGECIGMIVRRQTWVRK